MSSLDSCNFPQSNNTSGTTSNATHSPLSFLDQEHMSLQEKVANVSKMGMAAFSQALMQRKYELPDNASDETSLYGLTPSAYHDLQDPPLFSYQEAFHSLFVSQQNQKTHLCFLSDHHDDFFLNLRRMQFLNRYLKEGDVLLLEGIPFLNTVDREKFVPSCLIEKNIQVLGWDHIESCVGTVVFKERMDTFFDLINTGLRGDQIPERIFFSTPTPATFIALASPQDPAFRAKIEELITFIQTVPSSEEDKFFNGLSGLFLSLYKMIVEDRGRLENKLLVLSFAFFNAFNILNQKREESLMHAVSIMHRQVKKTGRVLYVIAGKQHFHPNFFTTFKDESYLYCKLRRTPEAD